MRNLIVTLSILFTAGFASAANLTCVVPSAAITRALEMCEVLRLSMTIGSPNWSNDECATEFLRRGLRNFDAEFTRSEAQQAVRNDVRDTLLTFDTNYPVAVVEAFCSDGTVNSEFGEECDDGNLDNGDGCDDLCQTE